ncbi:MAG: hypothetical protein JSR80_04655 [Verrucomicrobia bacterium]|nr:hypothetical protein [Verrucomicrobiota bacterium]
MNKITPAPPALLVWYADCSNVPGIPPVSQKEAVAILQAVARKKPYHDVVRMLARGSYDEDELSIKERHYWEKVFRKQEKSGKYEELPSLIPSILEGDILTDLSKLPPPPQKDKNEELFDIAKRVYLGAVFSPAVRGISVEWEGDKVVTSLYHQGELEGDADYMAFIAHIRIAAHYLKDYSMDNDRKIRVDPPQELPHHDRWVYLRPFS